MAETRYGICPLCEATCGITVEIENGKVRKVRGDEADPLSKGYICPKAVALQDLHDDPDRLRAPQKRVGDKWHTVGWDEALDEAAARLSEIQKQHGRSAVGLYVGNPSVHNYGGLIYTAAFLQVLRTRNLFTANSVDSLPRLMAAWQLYGSFARLPVPDLDRTQFWLIVGANPVASNGSVMTAPDCKSRLRAIRERGGKVVVIDPRRTETAELADRHYFVRPGSDALLLAALTQTVIEEKLSDIGRLAEVVTGRDELARLLARFTPEAVAAAVGLSAGEIRGLAREFAASPSAVCYSRMGACVQPYGALASWLTDVLNIVTGNLDRPGGAMFTTPPFDFAAFLDLAGQAGAHGRWRSRVSQYAEFNGELPVAALAEEIDTPGERRMRGFISYAGNPVLSLPNGRRLEKALATLDFMLAIDIYRNETTRHADIILPAKIGLEHDQFHFVFQALAVRNNAKYTPALVTAPPGVRDDWEIIRDLTLRLLRRNGGTAAPAAGPVRWLARSITPRNFIRAAVRMGPHGAGLNPFGKGLTLEQIEAAPHGLDLGPLEPRLSRFLGKRKINLAPPLFTPDLDRLARELVHAPSTNGNLTLIGRRQLRSNNSWMHNSERLVKGPPRCTLLMHPADAGARKIADGDTVTITSRVGAVSTRAEVTDTIMRGVVSLPHGWGHHRDGTQLSIASAHAGVSLNDLTDERAVDAVSGASVLNGVPVLVERAAGRPA